MVVINFPGLSTWGEGITSLCHRCQPDDTELVKFRSRYAHDRVPSSVTEGTLGL